jgi:glycosyltransferase involved in cell wall biosynthesis
LSPRKLVYQRTDRYEEFPNVDIDQIKKYDRKLKLNADLTIFVSKALYEREAGDCKNPLYLDHGVDYEKFALAEKDSTIPADIAGIPKPIVGFFGEVEHYTVDAGFLEKVADYLPTMSFILVGRIADDCSRLLAKKNVYALGQKPYELIPHYGKCFDVAIMPWRTNEWIDACNPIKLKEYLALGLPVVSTPFAELSMYREVVYEATTPIEFASRIMQALAENTPELVTARRKRVEYASWDSKAKLVLETLCEG